jgi:hypothetical protein
MGRSQQEYCQKRGLILKHQQNIAIELLFHVELVLSGNTQKEQIHFS